MDSVMKGLIGQCPQNFWARTARSGAAVSLRSWSVVLYSLSLVFPSWRDEFEICWLKM